MSLLVRCRSCRSDVEAGSCDRNLVCARCRAVVAITPDLRAYERAWRKREHYRRAGISLRNIDAQLVRLVVRMSGRAANHLKDGEAQRKLVNDLLAEARERVEKDTRRITLPA